MSLADTIERVKFTGAGIYLAIINQLVVGKSLLIISTMRALESLLTYPMITQVHSSGIAGCPGTDNNHTARFADEDTGGDSRFTWMFENDVGITPFTLPLSTLFALRYLSNVAPRPSDRNPYD